MPDRVSGPVFGSILKDALTRQAEVRVSVRGGGLYIGLVTALDGKQVSGSDGKRGEWTVRLDDLESVEVET